jgi:hypothetical protein
MRRQLSKVNLHSKLLSTGPCTQSQQSQRHLPNHHQHPLCIVVQRQLKMPPPRRANAPSSRNRGQSTLSFGSRARVTKTSLPVQPAKKKDAASRADEHVNAPASPPPVAAVPPTTAEIVIKRQAKEEARTILRTREEKVAAAVSDAQLKRYWRALEAERKAPRGTTSSAAEQTSPLSERLLTLIACSASRRSYRGGKDPPTL